MGDPYKGLWLRGIRDLYDKYHRQLGDVGYPRHLCREALACMRANDCMHFLRGVRATLIVGNIIRPERIDLPGGDERSKLGRTIYDRYYHAFPNHHAHEHIEFPRRRAAGQRQLGQTTS